MAVSPPDTPTHTRGPLLGPHPPLTCSAPCCRSEACFSSPVPSVPGVLLPLSFSLSLVSPRAELDPGGIYFVTLNLGCLSLRQKSTDLGDVFITHLV